MPARGERQKDVTEDYRDGLDCEWAVLGFHEPYGNEDWSMAATREIYKGQFGEIYVGCAVSFDDGRLHGYVVAWLDNVAAIERSDRSPRMHLRHLDALQPISHKEWLAVRSVAA